MIELFPSLLTARWRTSMVWPGDSRAAMRRSLIRILAVAHDERLPAATLVANLAAEHRGINRRLLRRLARRLETGLPLISALEQTPEVLSDSQVLAIRFGGQSGTLAETYRELITAGERPASSAGGALWQIGVYVVAMLLFLLWIGAFLFTFLYPTMEQIFDEFGIEAPAGSYQTVAAIYRHSGPWMLLLPLLGMVLVPVIWSSPLGRWLRRRLTDSRLRWVGQLRVAELLEMLASAAEAGRPLAGALSTLGRYHFDKPIRARLLFARNEVEQGASVWQSLLAADLLSESECQALAGATSPAARHWLMRGLAIEKRERTIVLAELAARALQTLVILTLAAIVLLLSCASYQFLTQLIFVLS